MRASLQDAGASQVAVVYDLDYRGLMPAYQAKIKIQFRQSYEYLRSRFTLNTLLFKTDLDAELEKTYQGGIHSDCRGRLWWHGACRRGTSPRQAEHAGQRAGDLGLLQTVAAHRGPYSAVDRGQLVAADPTAAAQQVAAGFSQPLEAVAGARGGVAGTTGPRLQGQSGDEGQLGRPDGASPRENPLRAKVLPGERPLTAVERWNQAGRPQAAFMLRSLTQEEQQDIEYDLFQVSATKRSIAPQGQIRLVSGDAQLAGRIQEVDLNSPFFERISGTVTTSADLKAAGVSSMIVKIRYGVRDDGTAPKDSAEFVFSEAGKKETYSFFLDRRLSIEIEYQIVVNYQTRFRDRPAGYAGDFALEENDDEKPGHRSRRSERCFLRWPHSRTGGLEHNQRYRVRFAVRRYESRIGEPGICCSHAAEAGVGIPYSPSSTRSGVATA